MDAFHCLFFTFHFNCIFHRNFCKQTALDPVLTPRVAPFIMSALAASFGCARLGEGWDCCKPNLSLFFPNYRGLAALRKINTDMRKYRTKKGKAYSLGLSNRYFKANFGNPDQS